MSVLLAVAVSMLVLPSAVVFLRRMAGIAAEGVPAHACRIRSWARVQLPCIVLAVTFSNGCELSMGAT